MTTHEREQLEGLISEWREKVAESGWSGNWGGSASQGDLALSRCADSLESLLDEMGDGWISVEERLPDNGCEVIVHDQVRGVCNGFFLRGVRDWRRPMFCDWTETQFIHVTHWQPLPGGPKR